MTDHAPAPVTADDLEAAVARAVDALGQVATADWSQPATGLDWSCWETVEHVSDDLFTYAAQLAAPDPPLDGYVPFGYEARRPGGPQLSVWVRPEDGVTGQLAVLAASAGLLASLVRTRGPEVRANHPDGPSDPAGFAAMGVVETLLHLHDVSGPLGFDWAPDDDLCARVRDRLFPDAPLDQPAWATLLWATGRGELPGRDRVGSWRWDARVRVSQPETRPALRANRSAPTNAVVPVLCYPDVRAAVRWLVEGLGCVERLQIADHRAQLRFGGADLVVAEGVVDASAPMLRVPDLDSALRTATSHGGTVEQQPQTFPFGERQARVADPFGRRWTLTQTVADVHPADWGGELRD